MLATVPDILDRIVTRKREELAALRVKRRDFRAALQTGRPAILAEIKKASPSKGVLARDFHPAETARQYEIGGAAAISVLTDRDFFQGSLADLAEARAAVQLPVLRKDFTVDPYHVIEAAAHGADAILLIAAILSDSQLRDLRELAESYGMDALVEVHDAGETSRAIDSGAEIIGVNNRDLRTFEVHLETSLKLADKIPTRVVKVSESGIHDAADIKRLAAAGFDAFLVGEHLMKSHDPAQALRALLA